MIACGHRNQANRKLSMAETYLPDDEYNAGVEFLLRAAPLLNIAPCPFARIVTENEIRVDLGLRCDIWPEYARPDDEED
jgi:hypothetical protein